MMKQVVYTIILLFFGTVSFAQAPVNAPVNATPVSKPSSKKMKIKTPPKDGFYARKDVDSSVMVPFADVREEDVYYSKGGTGVGVRTLYYLAKTED